MSWQARYNAQFTRTLKWQLFAIIARDMQSALNNVTGVVFTGMAGNKPQPAGALNTIVSYHKAALALEQFPSLLLTTERQAFDRAASQQSRDYAANFYVSLAVAHQEPNVVADVLEQYFLALDQVLTSAWELTTSDFYSTAIALPSPPFPSGAMSPGIQTGALTGLWIADLAYDEVRQTAKRSFARAGTMSLVCEMTEG